MRPKKEMRHVLQAKSASPDYSADQLEFLKAMDKFKRTVDRYPTPAEILAVARSLGYRRVERGGETVLRDD